eukprot:CAMPEP_0182438418 /NCGR_PEP_ID=MMETSP1167-20130531/85759_1 /TAXON_ID=2988 /ORGANISM="Mallomonas Sp, Strain CCMP3275" /LENGTH=419 /DNA_ID=CAMNT_0024631781 /DNA_START=1438 /DNA_END=2697 /DNA_ORIENTATION=-
MQRLTDEILELKNEHNEKNEREKEKERENQKEREREREREMNILMRERDHYMGKSEAAQGKLEKLLRLVEKEKWARISSAKRQLEARQLERLQRQGKSRDSEKEKGNREREKELKEREREKERTREILREKEILLEMKHGYDIYEDRERTKEKEREKEMEILMKNHSLISSPAHCSSQMNPMENMHTTSDRRKDWFAYNFPSDSHATQSFEDTAGGPEKSERLSERMSEKERGSWCSTEQYPHSPSHPHSHAHNTSAQGGDDPGTRNKPKSHNNGKKRKSKTTIRVKNNDTSDELDERKDERDKQTEGKGIRTTSTKNHMGRSNSPKSPKSKHNWSNMKQMKRSKSIVPSAGDNMGYDSEADLFPSPLNTFPTRDDSRRQFYSAQGGGVYGPYYSFPTAVRFTDFPNNAVMNWFSSKKK